MMTSKTDAAPARSPVNPFKGEPIGATGLVVYLDVFGGWRWEYHQANGEVRDALECYDTRAECLGDAARHGVLPAGPASRKGAVPQVKPSVRPTVAPARSAARPVRGVAATERRQRPRV